MKMKILIVDDSATTRAIIKRIIRMTDLPVEELYEAVDGAAALSLLATTRVDVVLADLNMPVMNGVELIRRMRADATLRDIPVIVISAQPDAQRIAQLQRDGVRGYLAKPFTAERLRDLISPIFDTLFAGVEHD
jgi:two-component system, chemotaxis family, chemotaxis protein CheY